MSGLDIQGLQLPTPGDVHYVRVDEETGLRADRSCQSTTELPFVKGIEPETWAPCASGGLGRVIDRLFRGAK